MRMMTSVRRKSCMTSDAALLDGLAHVRIEPMVAAGNETLSLAVRPVTCLRTVKLP